MARFLSFCAVLSCTLLSLLDQVGAGSERTTQKPAVVLVPAAFSKASVYDQVKGMLSDQGYCVVAIDLPSVGKAAAKVDREPDIKVLQKAIRQEMQRGKDVILVGNSYGGTVICDAVKDFEAKSSIKFTGRGKILGLIFFSGFLPYISELTPNTRPDIRTLSPPWFRFEGTSRVFADGNLTALPPSYTLYNLLPAPQAFYWASQLEPSSFAALNATARYIPYDGKFRSLYVVGSQDHAVTPELAGSYLAQDGAVWEKAVIEGDHSPMLSVPEKFVRIVRGFAGEKV